MSYQRFNKGGRVLCIAKSPFLAKSVQKLLNKENENGLELRSVLFSVRGEERIIRSCGWIEHKKPCYTTVLEEYNTYVCTCQGDGCNGSATITASLIGVASTLLVTSIFM